jgi:hypothetical protein
VTDQWRPYDAPGDGSSPPPPPPPTHRPYGSATYPTYDAGSERRRVRGRIGMLVVGVLVVLGGAGVGITALVVNALDDDGPSSTTTTTTTTHTEVHVDGNGEVDLFSTAATNAMTEALVKETGSAKVLEVILLQVQAVLTVPGDEGPRTLLWDGTSLTEGGPGFSARKPFDVGDLDGDVVARLCGVERAACTAIIGRPLPSDNGAWITIAGLDGVQYTDLAGNKP